MDGVQQWCRVGIVSPDGVELTSCVLEGPGEPNMATVHDVARMMLLARRLDGAIVLAELAPTLRELLELAGLPVEVEREPEFGKEPFRIQEVEEEASSR